MKILFLSKWYPNKYDAMAGLFVRKHAQAAARVCDVTVMYVFTDPRNQSVEITDQQKDGVREIIVAYSASSIRWLHALSSAIYFLLAYYKGFKYLLKQLKWRPDVIHVNVLTRHGVIAYLMKKLYHIPYVVTEHWSRYLPQNFQFTGYLRRAITSHVVTHAAAVMPVSINLKQAMEAQGLHNANYVIINNVVDDFFYDQPHVLAAHSKKRLLHVSCFDDKAKNVSGLLRSIRQLHHKRIDFELIIVGTGLDFDMATTLTKTLQLTDCVTFVGEQTPQQVKEWFCTSDLFVLFSNYENAPVVLSESVAVGVPAIATSVGGIPEMINDSNGRLVISGNEVQLTETIDWMLDHLDSFDKQIIKDQAYKYSYNYVGNQLCEIYQAAFNSTR